MGFGKHEIWMSRDKAATDWLLYLNKSHSMIGYKYRIAISPAGPLDASFTAVSFRERFALDKLGFSPSLRHH